MGLFGKSEAEKAEQKRIESERSAPIIARDDLF